MWFPSHLLRSPNNFFSLSSSLLLIRYMVSFYHSSMSALLKLFKSRLQTSLCCSLGRSTLRFPTINSLYSRSFGMRSSLILKTWGRWLSGETSTSQHYFVCNFMLPPNSENTTEASLVEDVNFLLLHIWQSPHFAAVQQSTANTSTINSRLCADS